MRAIGPTRTEWLLASWVRHLCLLVWSDHELGHNKRDDINTLQCGNKVNEGLDALEYYSRDLCLLLNAFSGS